MHDLNGIVLKYLPIADLKWVRDLEAYDGPLLSLFVHPRNNDNYLYYWCDATAEVNRWMVSRVSESNLIRLSNRKIPLSQIIPKGCEDDYVYFVDLDAKREAKHTSLVLLDNIPESYTPAQGVFLSEQVVDKTGIYHVMIERGFSDTNKWRILLKEFDYAYAFLYNVIKLKSQRVRSHPWRGGFSVMHFFKEMLRVIPVEDYPNVDSMKFSSPGYITYKLDADIAARVGNMVYNYISRGEEIDRTNTELKSYISLHKLIDVKSPVDSVWAQHDPALAVYAESLLKAMGIPEYKLFMESQRPFEVARMASSFAKRILELSRLELDRLISFPNTIQPGLD